MRKILGVLVDHAPLWESADLHGGSKIGVARKAIFGPAVGRVGKTECASVALSTLSTGSITKNRGKRKKI